MDSAYSWQCQQLSSPPHPRLLRHFRDFEHSPSPVLALGSGSKAAGAAGGPIRDGDLVALCLTVRCLQRTGALPLLRLDLCGELITCEGARTIAAVLQVSPALASLALRRTHVADAGAAAIAAALSSSQLLELDLGECAVSDAGLRYLVRGPKVHGAPPRLASLLLDGNATSDEGAIEVISFIEGGASAISCVSVHPAPPRFLSQEVEAALQVACELAGVQLERKGQVMSLETLASRCGQPQRRLDQQSLMAARPTAPTALAVPSAPGTPGTPSRARKQVPDVRSSGHLASWMAGTERELREMKWLLSSSTARLDGQHRKLMSELEKLRTQLDSWGQSSAELEEPRLDLLEARFDALEQLVGREQSECAQMWQLVEVAASAGNSRGA
ncbi:unnamed protein product [Effrenium voratum]|uniref:Uncharacterized protein n=1 Tax=Effrenium voratum TaxID=2562239 RepID=A0AA36I7G3_9DINO|nr:unnamed protein product [Effrenium voratum]